MEIMVCVIFVVGGLTLMVCVFAAIGSASQETSAVELNRLASYFARNPSSKTQEYKKQMGDLQRAIDNLPERKGTFADWVNSLKWAKENEDAKRIAICLGVLAKLISDNT